MRRARALGACACSVHGLLLRELPPIDPCGACQLLVLTLLVCCCTAPSQRLPDFLIATTDPEGEEFVEEVSSWKKQLLKLCDEMDFQGLQLINSETTGSPPTVEFRASFVPKG